MEGHTAASQISISVTDPQVDVAKGHHTYLVLGSDRFGPFDIRRRFNDFFYLRQILVKRWPAIYVPPIPEKKVSGNKDEQHVEFRRRFFAYFLIRLAAIPHLYYSPETQQFLRNKSIDMERYYQTIPTPKSTELVEKYTTSYQEVDVSNSSTTKAMTKISEFMMFLRKAEKQLKTVKEAADRAVAARDNFNLQLKLCATNFWPEFETKVFCQYLLPSEADKPKIFVANQNYDRSKEAFVEAANHNAYVIYADMIEFEVREVEAMIEAIVGLESMQASRRKLQERILSDQSQIAKLQGGKTTFKSIFSKGSRVDQIYMLERAIPESQKEFEGITHLIGIVYCILSSSEIPALKSYKRGNYFETVHQLAVHESKYLSTYHNFMQAIVAGINRQYYAADI